MEKADYKDWGEVGMAISLPGSEIYTPTHPNHEPSPMNKLCEYYKPIQHTSKQKPCSQKLITEHLRGYSTQNALYCGQGMLFCGKECRDTGTERCSATQVLQTYAVIHSQTCVFKKFHASVSEKCIFNLNLRKHHYSIICFYLNHITSIIELM